MSRLTTHVLDTAHGRPAGGIAFTLYRIDAHGSRARLAAGHTNGDGRAEAPLLAGADFLPGRYELDFEVAAYFRAKGVALPDPPFLERVTLRFGIADAQAHYHVPLLVSPWSYSTYRGS